MCQSNRSLLLGCFPAHAFASPGHSDRARIGYTSDLQFQLRDWNPLPLILLFPAVAMLKKGFEKAFTLKKNSEFENCFI